MTHWYQLPHIGENWLLYLNSPPQNCVANIFSSFYDKFERKSNFWPILGNLVPVSVSNWPKSGEILKMVENGCYV